MYIPKSMTKQIANTFYDKTIDVMDNNIVTDVEGGITSKGLVVLRNFKGNVSFSNCKKIKEEYGLDYEIDISITTNVESNIQINDLIKYDRVVYSVSDVLPTDSHILIVANKWQM